MAHVFRIVRGLAAALVLIVCLGLAAALFWRSAAQARNERAARIASPVGIAEAGYIRVGGHDHWVTIRGEDRRNPVLLILDGGPGYATSPFAPSPWERNFTVVHWDQPGAARTFARAGRKVDARLTEDDFADFGVALTEYARRRLGQEKVGILATSWGTLIGLRMIRERPDLFYAYVGAGQVVDGGRGEAIGYRQVMAKARRLDDGQAVKALQRIGPPPFASQEELSVQRTLATQYETGAPSGWRIARSLLTAPGYTILDVRNWFDGFLTSTRTFYEMRRARAAVKLGVDFHVPVFIFQGVEDDFTPHDLAREYFNQIRAPQKLFVSVPGAGHFAASSHLPELRELLLERVRPLGLLQKRAERAET